MFNNILYINPTDEQKKEQEERDKKLEIERINFIDRLNVIFSKLYGFNTFEETVNIIDQINELENEYVRYFCSGIMFPRPEPFKDFKTNANEFLKKFMPEWYQAPVIMTGDDKVNGYNLYAIDIGTWFRYDFFLKLEKLFNTENTLSEEEFMKRYDNEACSDWSKQDEHGECFGGFWTYPEGTPERENAYDLSREANGKALWNLPYSHELIFETISFGCGNRQESVRFTNFMCEYIKTKLSHKENMQHHKRKAEFQLKGKVVLVPRY